MGQRTLCPVDGEAAALLCGLEEIAAHSESQVKTKRFWAATPAGCIGLSQPMLDSRGQQRSGNSRIGSSITPLNTTWTELSSVSTSAVWRA